MPATKPWLETLTLDKLHRVAVNIGSPCSGTKTARVEGIRNVVSSVKSRGEKPLSLLSIDMGIRNLAFAHFTAPKAGDETPAVYDHPTLQAWRRVAIASSSASQNAAKANKLLRDVGSVEDDVGVATKESFEPMDYARHAYALVRDMLATYHPNHIIIERQRFRSGGRAAVPEWTIRVGVFEGMLYAVLRTLIEQGDLEVEVEPMWPSQVNRFWLEGQDRDVVPSLGKKLTGREVKRAKINIVGGILERHAGPGTGAGKISISEEIQPFAKEFVATWKKEIKTKKNEMKSIPKLDDLADSLLQGLAWIEWQDHRKLLEILGSKAVDMETGCML
ncbi:mitochondrial resolvase Ydc2 [Exophiala viscosa]|uniref:Mitochondrial resolvase Ydc2 n=1 Tax=Exophiala viscosa TaxID=2486360 RepID=A0AAN6E4Z4_9EURO|nr:mitochondrial resolvase Ydc2 [Exophiala viscosa]KAI1627097.1 mitochondrial resolvase Ydc2 [Exophiala viscosa]